MEWLMMIAASAGIPSAMIGLGVWSIQHKITLNDEKDREERAKRQKEFDERERAREQSELHMLRCVGASLALGEATARAVQRIPDAHCNGDMTAALEYAAKVKHEQKDFLNEQAIENLH